MEIASKTESFQKFIQARIETLRPKLLDLSRRNPLISTSLSLRSNSLIRVVDELPEVLAYRLRNRQAMRFFPLPPLEDDPKDEQSEQFQEALSNARFTDEVYLSALEKLDPKDDQHIAGTRQAERDLKDRVRASLDMAPRQKKAELSLPQHAINNGISPYYDLPLPSDEHEDGRHTDENIQTLLLPADLERKLNALMTKCRTWEQETGINVLHVAFGFLEWNEPNYPDSAFAPLVLLPVKLEKRKTREGTEFWVNADGDDLDTNFVIAEKMRNDFNIILPKFPKVGDIEEYFQEVAESAPKMMKWKIRRQIAFGVFPSARMAMYVDLGGGKHNFGGNGIISGLFGGTGTSDTPYADEYDVDNPSIESKVPYLVLDADASQFSTIVDVIDGKNIAVEGPPGTGKSQTIVNTIATAMAQGKKVLFVAEKMAALEVVKARLEAVGLGDFLLPLQAKRSTREQVIESIRNRLGMDIPTAPRDYETKIQKFRQVRAELAAYIETISAPFYQTGLNLYDIIGKSIATDHLLTDAPRCMQTPQIKGIENFDKATRDRLLEAGYTLEKAWKESSQAAPYWRGLMVPHLDRFTSSTLEQLAQDVGTSFDKLQQGRKLLKERGVDATVKELCPLLEGINALLSLMSKLDSAKILAVYRSIGEGKIKNFLDEFQWLQSEVQILKEIVKNPFDQDTSEMLRKISRICEKNTITTLDIEKLRNEIEIIKPIIDVKKETLKNIRKLIEFFPDAGSIEIDTLRLANKVIHEFDRRVIDIRNELIASPALVAILAELCQTGRNLYEERLALTTLISTAIESSASELHAYAERIKNSGIFSWLTPSFRTAKRFYMAHTRRESFEKNVAAGDLQSLAEWKEAERKFIEAPQTKPFFGVHFNGLDTDFLLFKQLVLFYQRVETCFPGPPNRKIREILKTGDSEFLLSIPTIPDDESAKTLRELESEILKLEYTVNAQLEPITELEKNIHVLLQPGIDINYLNEIADRIDSVCNDKHELDNNIIIQSIFESINKRMILCYDFSKPKEKVCQHALSVVVQKS